MPSAAEKYHEAITLYRDTDLSISEISQRCGVSRNGLAVYIQRNHRDLMMARKGIKSNPEKKLHRGSGQRSQTKAKYREAIEACDSEKYISLNLSQIASIFHLNPSALANQLRAHYPEILSRREAERQKRGIADNTSRGVNSKAKITYANAIQLLRDTDMTIEEVAEKYGVSFSGLRQHILFYHKDIIRIRKKKREQGKKNPIIGKVSGNGQIRKPSEEIIQKYAEGVELYRTTTIPLLEIAKQIGVTENAFRDHLKKWHKDLPTGHRSRTVAEKYAKAIEILKQGTEKTESVAKRFGFTPEVLRTYIKKHEPELFNSLGMMTLPNGKRVLRKSYERYSQAIEAFSSSCESLKSVADRFGIPYKTLSGFIHRNLPELLHPSK